jgi:hypothetical protein
MILTNGTDQITGAARGIGKAADAALKLKGKYGTG